jgi:hypothetical protein
LTDQPLFTLSDIATDAHTRIQQDFKGIDPIIGVNRSMRKNGVPADAMTIDCLKSGKRIILILHDQQADVINYQFSFKNTDPGDKFDQIKFDELNADKLYEWIRDYFLAEDS